VTIRKEYNGGGAYGMNLIFYIKPKFKIFYVYEAFVATGWHCG
jgi:hypothetical protein